MKYYLSHPEKFLKSLLTIYVELFVISLVKSWLTGNFLPTFLVIAMTFGNTMLLLHIHSAITRVRKIGSKLHEIDPKFTMPLWLEPSELKFVLNVIVMTFVSAMTILFPAFMTFRAAWFNFLFYAILPIALYILISLIMAERNKNGSIRVR